MKNTILSYPFSNNNLIEHLKCTVRSKLCNYQNDHTMEKRNANNSKSIFTNIKLENIFRGGSHFQPFQMYYEVNKEICKRTIFHDIDHDILYDTLVNKYSVNKNDVVSIKRYCFKLNKHIHHSYLICIGSDLWVYFGQGDNDPGGVSILYSSNSKQQVLNELELDIISTRNKSIPSGKIYLIHKFDYGFDLRAYDVYEIYCDIKSHYNNDFEEFNSNIIKRLNKDNDKGLVLLHGKPGTGKTSYIRYLTKNINKRMIFLSPEVSQYISSPEFITILSEYPNSVIIIEDAENIIKTRKSGGSSAISNLLNLTDGLLSDCLKIQLICSFNTDVSQIDKALLRKGRLIGMYEFNELKQEKAIQLAQAIGKPYSFKTDTILAEIFNQDEVRIQQESTKKIGFCISN